jgi:uncharacterized protein (DUF2235 family)
VSDPAGAAARRLSVRCDGTWLGVRQDSNVARLHRAIVPAPGDPEPLYVTGVGVSGNPVDVVAGGLIGAGLSRSITAGYRWLVEQFRAGDRVAVFGFSRGAYTARSLAGMVARVGLVDGTGLGPQEVTDAVDRAYERYRAFRTTPVDPSSRRPCNRARGPSPRSTPTGRRTTSTSRRTRGGGRAVTAPPGPSSGRATPAR